MASSHEKIYAWRTAMQAICLCCVHRAQRPIHTVHRTPLNPRNNWGELGAC